MELSCTPVPQELSNSSQLCFWDIPVVGGKCYLAVVQEASLHVLQTDFNLRLTQILAFKYVNTCIFICCYLFCNKKLFTDPDPEIESFM